jgi:AAA+ ATPase superfamily predicted ATPase
MFIGREPELEELQSSTKPRRATLIVCRGRRRIGKSRLIEEFGRKFPKFVRFEGLAPREGIDQRAQLSQFSKTLSQAFALPELPLSNWSDAFELLANQSRTGKILILFDEISWMAQGDPDFAGWLKIVWDERLKKNPNLALVLCGSVSAWIEENILRHTAFVGRISLTLTLGELPLPACNAFWGKRASSVSPMEKFKFLAVTGGIPRYLEELDPSTSVEQNLAAMCFRKSGILFNDFETIFQDIFTRRANAYRDIVHALVGAPLTFSEVCHKIGKSPNGVITEYLDELELSGLLARDHAYSPKTLSRAPRPRYRIRDNYLRFYLKYIEPHRDQVEKEIYTFKSIAELKGIETIFGFQFENLVFNQLPGLIGKLGIQAPIENASPYFQSATKRRKSCQIDLLIRTRSTLYVGEIKYRKKITGRVVEEVREKVRRLGRLPDLTIRPFLVHVGELAPAIVESDYFDRIVSLADLLE